MTPSPPIERRRLARAPCFPACHKCASHRPVRQWCVTPRMVDVLRTPPRGGAAAPRPRLPPFASATPPPPLAPPPPPPPPPSLTSPPPPAYGTISVRLAASVSMKWCGWCASPPPPPPCASHDGTTNPVLSSSPPVRYECAARVTRGCSAQRRGRRGRGRTAVARAGQKVLCGWRRVSAAAAAPNPRAAASAAARTQQQQIGERACARGAGVA